MRDELKAISLDVLARPATRSRSASRRRAAPRRSAAAGEMARRAEEIKGLVRPVQEKLGRMESEIGRLERERRQAQGELAQMLRQLGDGVGTLRQETGNLVSALKRPSTRGSWGEIQLRNVVEMAGMVAHCDFVEQSTIQTPDGALRPDMLVRLPGGKLIVVDSKVPLDAYLSALEATDEQASASCTSRATRKQTREHIAKLALKGYQRQFDSTPEFVVMFVPSDGIYQAALAAGSGADRVRRPAAGADGHADDPDRPAVGGPLRLAPGADRRVGARDRRRRRASCTAASARFVEPLAKVGRQLDSAISAYNEAVGSFDASRDPAGAAHRAGRRRLRARRARAGRGRDHRAGAHRAAGVRAGRVLAAGRGRAARALRRGERVRRRMTIITISAKATGTVAGSSSTTKNSRSKPSAKQRRQDRAAQLQARRPSVDRQQRRRARRR